jgi:hypothetical protein
MKATRVLLTDHHVLARVRSCSARQNPKGLEALPRITKYFPGAKV